MRLGGDNNKCHWSCPPSPGQEMDKEEGITPSPMPSLSVKGPMCM